MLNVKYINGGYEGVCTEKTFDAVREWYETIPGAYVDPRPLYLPVGSNGINFRGARFAFPFAECYKVTPNIPAD